MTRTIPFMMGITFAAPLMENREAVDFTPTIIKSFWKKMGCPIFGGMICEVPIVLSC